MFLRKKGFTLIELLVVIAIIGMLSSVVVNSLNIARNKAKSVNSVSYIDDLHKVILIYMTDTGQNPPFNCMEICNSTNDPFLNSMGISGWRGPYTTVWSKTHPWGGQLGYENFSDDITTDGDKDGKRDYFIFLNDDRVGTSISDNGGRVSLEGMYMIDEMLDDGNLSTGDVRGNGGGWVNQGTSQGEMAIKFNVD